MMGGAAVGLGGRDGAGAGLGLGTTGVGEGAGADRTCGVGLGDSCGMEGAGGTADGLLPVLGEGPAAGLGVWLNTKE